jgi:hypothetical protein
MRLSSIASPLCVNDLLMSSTWNLLYWESKWMPPGVFTESAQEIRLGRIYLPSDRAAKDMRRRPGQLNTEGRS